MRCRDWSVEVALLKQHKNVSSVNARNGRNAVPLEELLECTIYSWHNVRRKADHVLFIGDFSAEQSQALVDCGRKLLSARMQSMLTTSISDNIVQSIYSNLCPVSGKQGFDVTRLGGTGGCTCDQSTKDLLYISSKMILFCQKSRSMFNNSCQKVLLDLLHEEQSRS